MFKYLNELLTIFQTAFIRLERTLNPFFFSSFLRVSSFDKEMNYKGDYMTVCSPRAAEVLHPNKQ